MISTFSGFYMAKGGMDAARAGLNVTGQNMLNAKSPGYTRQRVDQYAAGANSRNSRYATAGAVIGRGVEVTGISQIRDPYLDLRFRREHTKLGDSATELDSLTDLKSVIDEISKDGVNKQLEDLKAQFDNLSKNPGDTVAEGILKNSALTLIKLFNSTSTHLTKIKNEQLEYMQGAVGAVNNLLSGISHLNGEIRKANVGGDKALELLDQRNLMIDELSGYVNIEVNTKQVSIGSGYTVDELEINMIGDNGQTFNLISNNKNGSIGLAKDADGKPTFPVAIQLFDKNKNPVTGSISGGTALVDGNITGHIKTGALNAHLKALNNSGEYDNPSTTERGIGYYENRLDTLASTLADAFNKTNSMNTAPPWDKPMFESSDGGPITASNIQIAQKWTNSKDSYITSTKDGDTSESKNGNLIAMIDLFTATTDFATPTQPGPPPSGGESIFKGTFNSYFADMSTTLGVEFAAVERENKSYNSVISDIDSQRSSVSGVDEGEEGVNMIQFNHALTAASRFMTTLDEAVDTIINRMGVVGR